MENISAFVTQLKTFLRGLRIHSLGKGVMLLSLLGLAVCGVITANSFVLEKSTITTPTKSKASLEKVKKVTSPVTDANKDGVNEIVAEKTGTTTDEVSLYRAGVALVKKHEGLYLFPYYCPAGVLTIGWGHTYPYQTVNGKNVLTQKGREELYRHRNGITADEAQRMFVDDFRQNLAKVTNLVHPEERKHLLALTSLMYNAGERGMMSKGSAVGQSYIDGANNQDIANRIKNRYVKNTIYEKGIKARRQNEAALYLGENIGQKVAMWETEVNNCLRQWLSNYNIPMNPTTKSRMQGLPQTRRSKIELSNSDINKVIQNGYK